MTVVWKSDLNEHRFQRFYLLVTNLCVRDQSRDLQSFLLVNIKLEMQCHTNGW